MSSNPPARLSPRMAVVMLLALATIAKFIWAATSLGTTDSMLFYFFGESIERHGLAALYTGTTVFNHTPLTAWIIDLLFRASHAYYPHFESFFGQPSGGPGLKLYADYPLFAFTLRLGSILADIALVLGLLHVKKLTGQPPWWALCLFAVSPVSIMVSGFHGNIDPIMVVFLFYAAVAVLTDRPALCGALFAAACNVKIAPILIAPVFLFYWIGRGWRPAAKFMAASGALMLAGAAWGLMNCPAAFIRNVFGYGSYWGTWGVTYLLNVTGVKDFSLVSYTGLTAAQNEVISALKFIIIAGVLVIAWRRRKLGGLDFFGTLTAAYAWLFIFMPGAGPQYMVWFAPFLLLSAPRWWLAFTAASALFMFRFYDTTSHGHFPWDLALPRGPEQPYWAPWTLIPWSLFIALICCEAAAFLRSRKPRPAPPAAMPEAA